jgi:hypothetical protein
VVRLSWRRSVSFAVSLDGGRGPGRQTRLLGVRGGKDSLMTLWLYGFKRQIATWERKAVSATKLSDTNGTSRACLSSAFE